MDAALALGPVQVECNVCGRTHVVTPLADAVKAHYTAGEWDQSSWARCLAARCASGFEHAEQLTSIGQFASWLEQLHNAHAGRFMLGARQYGFGSYVYSAVPNLFSCSAEAAVEAIRHIHRFVGYESMVRSSSRETAGRLLSAFALRNGLTLNPCLLGQDSRWANRLVARTRVSAFLNDDAWTTVLTASRDWISAVPDICHVLRGSDQILEDDLDICMKSVWNGVAAGNAIILLYAQLERELEGLEPRTMQSIMPNMGGMNSEVFCNRL